MPALTLEDVCKAFTDRDREHAHETWTALTEGDPEDYDGPETIMTSIGYVDVWLDGDVTAHGVIIANVAG